MDPIEEPIPVSPTAHYTMGGIPTNRFGQVVAPEKHGPEEAAPGLYAVGECACVSVHGANRLGGNSLLDIVVFGRAAGNHIIEYLRENRRHRPLDETSIEQAHARLTRWERTGEGESVAELTETLRRVMEQYCGVFRTQEVLDRGIAELTALQARLEDARLRTIARYSIRHGSRRWNGNLSWTAIATMVSAAALCGKPRRAHALDHPARRRELVETRCSAAPAGGLQTGAHETADGEAFPPKERIY